MKQNEIKVWVLTGDKVETAKNIGYSCKLLTSDMEHIMITEEEENKVEKQLDEALKELGSKKRGEGRKALIVTGPALIGIMPKHKP